MSCLWFQQVKADKIIKAKVSDSRVSEESEDFGWEERDEAIESDEEWKHGNKFNGPARFNEKEMFQ